MIGIDQLASAANNPSDSSAGNASGHLHAVAAVISNHPFLLAVFAIAGQEDDRVTGFAVLVEVEVRHLNARRVVVGALIHRKASRQLAVSFDAGKLDVSWPARTTGLALKTSATLGSGANWTPMTAESSNRVTLDATGAATFYRLRMLP